jgi:excisionase family DNA binding protein
MLSVRQLARQLGCSRETVRKAIADGTLKAKKVHAKLWAIEADQRDLVFFKARLEHLSEVRCFRSLLMRALWQSGKLRARRRRMGQPVTKSVVILRPKALAAERVQSPIFFRNEHEAEGYCPHCRAHLRILMG